MKQWLRKREFSGQVISIPDRGGKLIPPVRNGDEKVLENDFVILCDGTMRHCSLADLRLLEGM